ncbi:hypothetical protein GCM10010533_27910 [Mycolicibacterium pallens]
MTVNDVAGWNIPDSDICSAALHLVTDVSPAFLTNHCIRSYLFGRELAAADGMRAGTDYDDELVFLSCVLHDLGITAYGGGDQRFEVDGADAAARFLGERSRRRRGAGGMGNDRPAHQRRPGAPLRTRPCGLASRNCVGHQRIRQDQITGGVRRAGPHRVAAA